MGAALPLAQAVAVLRAGGVVAYPTEAVWGLGCDPADEAAVMRLLSIKQRPVEKGLILVADHLDRLRPWLDLAALPAERLATVLASWPGPHTWVLPATTQAPRWITGGRADMAVRVSAHAGVVELCRAYDGALVSTSANRTGAEPPRRLQDFDPQLLAGIDGWLPGEVGGQATPTTIRLGLTGEVLRG